MQVTAVTKWRDHNVRQIGLKKPQPEKLNETSIEEQPQHCYKTHTNSNIFSVEKEIYVYS